MSRLVVAVLLLAAVIGILSVLALGLRSALRAGAARVEHAQFGGHTLQRLSFLLLVALILYVSIWGGA